MPTDPDRALTNGDLLEQLREAASELNWRLENYLRAAGESKEAADEGYLLAVKAEGIWNANYHGDDFFDAFCWRKRALKRLVEEPQGVESDA